MNLSHKIIENCENIPNKKVLIQKNKEITYKELYLKIASFKEYLESNGIKKGNKVLILVPMSIELYVSLFAIWSIGATACFMDAGFIKNGMKNNSFDEIDCVIGIPKYLLYANINKSLRKIKKINVKVINNLTNDKKLEVEELENDFPAILTYTSGTTGKSKTACRSHEFLLHQGDILENCLDYEENDIELSSIPIFSLSNINAGITTVIANAKFSNLGLSNPINLVNQIKKNKINRIMSAPGLLNVITDYCLKNDLKIKSVKKVFTGGGAVFLDLIENIKKVFPNAQIVTAYGSTEAEPIAKLHISEMSEEDIEKTKNGYGILAGTIVGVEDCKIIKTGMTEIGDITQKEFQELQTDGIGEIVVTGKNVLKGYVNGIGDKENKFSVDGIKYHRTGDLGKFDEAKRLWLQGRIKEPFLAIEAVLHGKLKIGKTAIFEKNGKIILVLENKDNITEKEIKQAINFTQIDEIIHIKKIPVDKRHSTKVNYIQLKKLYKG